MRVTMMGVAECSDTDKVNHQPKCAYCQELPNALHFAPFDQTLDRFVNDLEADKPVPY